MAKEVDEIDKETEVCYSVFIERFWMTSISDILKDVPNGTESSLYTTAELHTHYIGCCNDPTEVMFVDTYLGGDFDVWEKMKNSAVFKKTYLSWRVEARQRYLKENLKGIIEIAADEGSKSRFAALKYLCDTGFVNEEEKRGAGRPSKAEVEGAKQQLLKEDKELAEAFNRIGKYTGTASVM